MHLVTNILQDQLLNIGGPQMPCEYTVPTDIPDYC